MIRFNCAGKPYIDEQLFKEAINDWAKAKGVDPDHIFTANNWDAGNINPIYYNPPSPLSMLVKSQINTSVFEEINAIG